MPESCDFEKCKVLRVLNNMKEIKGRCQVPGCKVEETRVTLWAWSTLVRIGLYARGRRPVSCQVISYKGPKEDQPRAGVEIEINTPMARL